MKNGKRITKAAVGVFLLVAGLDLAIPIPGIHETPLIAAYAYYKGITPDQLLSTFLVEYLILSFILGVVLIIISLTLFGVKFSKLKKYFRGFFK